ncbi:MFS transporter [Sediminibacillus albus]|uniref:MFS transporter, ACDE family, multidrug resistance protein n=1 Tax=Sediminibacillus albus TaxID=407036 RepID=A0A1G8XFW0_9BACI|nr:MFS transporter [Sediminibacillus albus]SDJ89452.1 MFS transporter, ACDE family, multidrug resistance protein [Sediminibacillus albus]
MNSTNQPHHQESEVHEKRWAIVSLASIPLIMTLGNSMLIPVLPLMEKEMDISKLQSSYIITVYSIVAIFFIPLAGFLSDRFGRKIVILPSLAVVGVGGLISGYASWKIDDPFLFILLGRILQGIGTSGTAPIVLPLVGDMFRREEDVSSTLGLIETSNTFGKVLSPILGAILAGVIWYLPFFAIPVFCLISMVLIFLLVKKPKNDEKGPKFKEFRANTKKAFQEHGGWLTAVFAIGAILMFILFGILFYLSSVLEDHYHFTGIKKGFYLAGPLAALCLASYITGRVIKDDLVKMKWITFSGILLSGLAVIAVRFSDQFIYLLMVFLICGIGIGAGLPCLDALITESIDKGVRGTITCIYSSARYLGVAAGPPVIALLMKVDLTWMVVLLASLAVVAALLSFKAIRPEADQSG